MHKTKNKNNINSSIQIPKYSCGVNLKAASKAKNIEPID